MPLTLKNFNKAPEPAKTYTIVWNETSTPSEFFVRYEDDASGMTQGSTDFDRFFGYSAVKLASDGTESAEVTQSSPGVLNITELGTLTSGDNVMIKFPVRGIKMSKSGSTVTLSITNELGKSGYQYYAFQNTGDISSNTEETATHPLYLGAYLSYNSSNVSKSWSGQIPQNNYTLSNEISYASANGTGRTIMGWYQRCLINAYYMLKYGNPDSKTIIGRGYVDGNSYIHITGGTDGVTNATYGNTSGNFQCKLFGIEDWRGNQPQWIGGMFTNGSKNMYVALHDFTASTSTSQSQYKSVGTISGTGSYYCMSSILGTNKGMFGLSGTVNNTSYNTYYCNMSGVEASSFAQCGGNNVNGNSAGAFNALVAYTTSNAGHSRLMYL